MTATRDPDRLLRAWLDLMADEAPDRVIASVLQATESAPQVRPSLGTGPWRLPMNRFPILVAATAAILIVVGAAFVVGPGPGPGGRPTPSPSVAASLAASVPEELRYAWLGELRTVAGLPTDRSLLGFDASKANYLEGFGSTVTVTSDGRLRLTLDAAHAPTGCGTGDVGTYAYTLSTGGTKLSLTPAEDQCEARSQALAGDWLRSNCLSTENLCLGALEAGTYQSFFFAPRIADDAEWAPDFGALSYTVPAGWAATFDYPRNYSLEPADWYVENRGDISAEGRGIYVASHAIALEPGNSCAPAVAGGVDRSATALSEWLAAHPALDAEAPVPITIDGVSGAFVDAAIDMAASEICRTAPTPVAVLIGDAVEPVDGPMFGALEGHRDRWIFLDLEPGRPIMVSITGRVDLFDDLLAEAMPIVESFQFE